MKMVVLDVETTGVAYSRGDRIIQLAFVILEDGQITDKYTTYINPHRNIPSFIKGLTNITEKQVSAAPDFSEIAPNLLEALNNAYMVAHNIDFDLGFINEELEAAGYFAFQGPVIDTVELARVTFPTEESYQLGSLADKFNLEHLDPHRADSDAYVTAELLQHLIDELKMLPVITLKQLQTLSKEWKSDLQQLLDVIIKEKKEDLVSDVEVYRGIALKKITEKENDENSFDYLFDHFIKDQFLKSDTSDDTPQLEVRQGQIDMMNFINQCFESIQFGLIEAGTGTGKTLGYLIPAAFKAKSDQSPVVISTETIQLQDQLLKNDFPLLNKLLPFQVTAALLKGRSHYLCLQKFDRLLDRDPLPSYDRSVSKGQILVWLNKTTTGDVEELSLVSGGQRFWREVESDGQSCSSPKCPWFSRCFYQRARKAAKQADLIITNHSLLISDVVANHQVIPSYQNLIIDEAHHLEETATRQLGNRLDYHILIQRLNELSGKEYEALLASISSILEKESEEFFEMQININLLKEEWNDLFILFADYTRKSKEHKNDYGRISKIIDHQEGSFEVIKHCTERCLQFLKELITTLEKLLKKVNEKKDFEEEWGLKVDFERITRIYQDLQEVQILTESMVMNPTDQEVYWLEGDIKGPKHSVWLQKSPISVSVQLADRLFSKKETVIFTSATLSVNKSFKYFKDRIGISELPHQEMSIPSPFKWDDQASLMISSDMPLIQEAGERVYIEAAAMHIYQIAEVTKGRMLVLFTSYDMLRQTYNLLKTMFDDTYMLIGQGIQSKNRSKLTKNFRQFERSVLLGTSSFWEGIDIPGEDLSVIVMVRLPFSPPNDPIFQARSELVKEKGRSPFMDLALPQAVIRFKQGFGRLIRSSTDHGVVVILDRRIVTAKYGGFFTRSLPKVLTHDLSLLDMEAKIEEWFTKPSEEERRNEK